jgi:hypothetical protein
MPCLFRSLVAGDTKGSVIHIHIDSQTASMANKCLVVCILGETFQMHFNDMSFPGKGAVDVGQLGCKVWI